MQLCLALMLNWFLGSKSQGIGSKLTFSWQSDREREGGRHTVQHNFRSIFHCLWALSSCEFVLFKWVSFEHRPTPSSFYFVISYPSMSPVLIISPVFFSAPLPFYKLWLEIIRQQTVHPSGPNVNIWRGCWLFWHGGRDTHESHILQFNCMCVCVVVFLCCICVSVHLPQTLSPLPLSPPLAANYCPA